MISKNRSWKPKKDTSANVYRKLPTSNDTKFALEEKVIYTSWNKY